MPPCRDVLSPSDEDLLDALLAVVRSETLRKLRGAEMVVAKGDVEGDAIYAAVLTMMLLVRRHRDTL